MGLDPKLLNSLPDTLVDMYGLVEIDILSDMARRISTYDYFIPAAQHQNQKLQELGMVQSEIIARLSALTGRTQTEIVDLLSIASAEAVEDDVEYYTAAEVYEPSKVNTEALHAQLNSGLLQTQGLFKNITRTTANSGGIQFIEALDRAWTQINSGGFDYNTAIKNAITDLAEQGLCATNSKGQIVNGAIKYNKSGRVDTLEVAVRRAVVTGANQTAMKTQEMLADELEVDLVEVTAHGGARPSHAKWQGQVFSRKGRVTIDGVTYEDLTKATGYGRADGLGGVNCRHNFHPYVPGAPRAWSDEELKALEEKKITYNGEKLTEYEASQVQRGIEREIRKQKRTVEALEAAGLDSSEERKKLREAQKTYTDFSEQTGMKKQSARTQIASAKAEREVRAANRSAGVKSSTKKGIDDQREDVTRATNTVTGGRQYNIDPVTPSQRNGEIVSQNTAQPLINRNDSGQISLSNELGKTSDGVQRGAEREPPKLDKIGENGIIVSGKQFGKKTGEHARDYGLDPSKAEDRDKMREIITDIIENHDDYAEGEWRMQKGICSFYIKGEDVVVVNSENKFVTILKGGITNARVKNARKRKV